MLFDCSTTYGVTIIFTLMILSPFTSMSFKGFIFLSEFILRHPAGDCRIVVAGTVVVPVEAVVGIKLLAVVFDGWPMVELANVPPVVYTALSFLLLHCKRTWWSCRW